jgi:hypothetical protein
VARELDQGQGGEVVARWAGQMSFEHIEQPEPAGAASDGKQGAPRGHASMRT